MLSSISEENSACSEFSSLLSAYGSRLFRALCTARVIPIERRLYGSGAIASRHGVEPFEMKLR